MTTSQVTSHTYCHLQDQPLILITADISSVWLASRVIFKPGVSNVMLPCLSVNMKSHEDWTLPHLPHSIPWVQVWPDRWTCLDWVQNFFFKNIFIILLIPKKTENIAIWMKNSLLTKLFHLTLRRSTTTYSIRSRCSNFGPNTIKLRADLWKCVEIKLQLKYASRDQTHLQTYMVWSSPVSEFIVSKYLDMKL